MIIVQINFVQENAEMRERYRWPEDARIGEVVNHAIGRLSTMAPGVGIKSIVFRPQFWNSTDIAPSPWEAPTVPGGEGT